MKKIILLCTFCVSVANLFAQKETYDLITYSPPQGWSKEVKENLILYTIVNKKNSSWCQVGIIKSTASKGDIEKDFESEWHELIVKNYKPTESAQVNDVQESDGWKIKAGTGKFIFNGADAAAMLTTASGYDRCVSIVVVTNSQDYITDVETLLSSIDLVKPQTNEQQQTNNDGNTSILGTWGKQSGVHQTYGDPASYGNAGYSNDQYTFNSNGTYSFVSKTFRSSYDKIILVKENGTYQINNNNITINPQKSIIETWSKKDGTDKWGQLVSSQNRALEKVTYQFTKHYFSGIQEWNLVLQCNNVTEREGPFSNNTTFANAWYYRPIVSNNPKIELPDGQYVQTEEIKTEPVKQTGNNQFAFATTNFDDGWTSTVQEDWVQVIKGTIKVLIHYPNKNADAYNSVLMDGLKNAWNILVAPKYSSASNFEFKPITGWQSIEFAEADMVEKTTGNTVHVVLFKMNYSNGSGRYLEFITPDKRSFEQEFGAYHETSSGWEKMENMAFRNKFAIAASDLQGKWTSDFSGAIQYVNAYTGFDAGMDTHASNENFQFWAGNTYKWDLGVASGAVGNIKFQSVKSGGKFSMAGNWKVNFSDIEGKPRTYDAYFSCIKGLRILWLDNRAFAKAE